MQNAYDPKGNQEGGPSASFDRFQNNNVSAAAPGKALVSPRNGHPVQQQVLQQTNKNEKPSPGHNLQSTKNNQSTSFNFSLGSLGGVLSARNPVAQTQGVLPALEH